MGLIIFLVNGWQKMILVEKMKYVEINDEFWYYVFVDKGEIIVILF